MSTIKLQPSGAVVLKDGKVACACCGPMIISYSYEDDPSLGKGFDECPLVAPPCGMDAVASCSGATISGFLYSDVWPTIPAGKTAKAKVYGGAQFDNFGNIAGENSDNQGSDSCVLGYIYNDFEVTASVDIDKRMKIPFFVQNAVHGGPYGLYSATIEWYWQ